MATQIYLGYPPENIKKWIMENVVIEPAESPLTKIWFTDEPDKCYEYDWEGDLKVAMTNEGFIGDGINTPPFWILDKQIVKIECGSKITAITPCEDGNSIFTNSLEEITFSSNISVLVSALFYGCSNLKTVNIPQNTKIKSLGSNMFRDCTSLTSITIPDNIIELLDNTFYGCTSLTTIYISDNISYITDTQNPNLFFNCPITNLPNCSCSVVEKWFNDCVFGDAREVDMPYNRYEITCKDGSIYAVVI